MLKNILRFICIAIIGVLLVGLVYFSLKIDKQVEEISCRIQKCSTLTDASEMLAEEEKNTKFFHYYWTLEYKLPSSSLWKISMGIGPFMKTSDIKEDYSNYKVILYSEEDANKVESFLQNNSIEYQKGRE